MAAELMIPKWFDKSPHRSNADNIDDLSAALTLAAAAYRVELGAIDRVRPCAVPLPRDHRRRSSRAA